MDGITGMGDGSVDGMPLHRHTAVLDELRGLLEAAFAESAAELST